MKIRDAAEKWINDYMDHIQTGIIEKLMNFEPENWKEITLPVKGSSVFIYKMCERGEVIAFDEQYKVELDSGKCICLNADDMCLDCCEPLPMWGTMWSFRDSFDDTWLEKGGGLRIMSECGFRIYENRDFGIFFGIDGAGYDFYTDHWIPLYKARGLHWHEED